MINLIVNIYQTEYNDISQKYILKIVLILLFYRNYYFFNKENVIFFNF